MRPIAARLALFGSIILIASTAVAAPQPTAAPSSQSLTQRPGEEDEVFVRRVLELGDTDVHVLAANWNGVRTLFADYLQVDDPDTPERPLIALEQVAPGKFRKLEVTVGETEGGEAVVAAIGFANADRDQAKELIVILAWNAYHALGCSSFYEVRIFDNLEPAQGARQMPISRHFGGGCAHRDEGRKPFRFTTISSVKAELSRLGY